MDTSLGLSDTEFRAIVEGDFTSGDSTRIINALLSVALNFGDYDLAVSSVSRFFAHQDQYVRGCSITCVSHIARLWGKVPADFLVQVESALADSSTWVSGKADTTIDDLEVFIETYKRSSNLT